MQQFYLLIICLTLGQISRLFPAFPKETSKILNTFVLYISLPALIILKVPDLIRKTQFSLDLFIPVSMAWIMLIMSYFLFSRIGKSKFWSPQTTGALILTAGLANTSFIGFPLLQALRGNSAIETALINDQLGTFLSFATLGIVIAQHYSQKEIGSHSTPSLKKSLIRISKFPPLLTLASVSLLYSLDIYLPITLNQAIAPIAKTLSPLALFAVGFSLKINISTLIKYSKTLTLGLLFKLFFAPLFFFILYRIILNSSSEMSTVTILESAMASMISASIICEEFELDTQLANLMVGISIPISFLSVPLLNYFLS